MSPSLVLLASLALLDPPTLPQKGNEVAEKYHAAAAVGDREALTKLWKENPGAILFTIDADLEGSLKLVESSDSPDAEAIKSLHERALFGARCAEAATGRPIFVDYASSFVGWTRDQQKNFRGGQAAYGRARKFARDGKHDEALAAGRECANLAEPLGDWWGTAMGRQAEGSALAAMGKHEEALVAFSRARMIYADLGLAGSEYSNLRGMIECLEALERDVRLLHSVRQAVALGRLIGDEKGTKALLTKQVELEEKMGDESAARTSRRELEEDK